MQAKTKQITNPSRMSVPKKKEKKKDMFICSDIIVGFSQAGQLCTYCMYGLVGMCLVPTPPAEGYVRLRCLSAFSLAPDTGLIM